MELSSNRETDHLISMANDIAMNFRLHDDAESGIADHINRFWAPRMRGLLLDYARENGHGLSELVLAALNKVRR